MKYDVIIIGSGLGGLECAHILSRKGLGVLLLEREQHPGGCMQSYLRNGYSFDTGFHYVGGLSEGQSLHSAFDCLNLLRLPWQHLDSEGFDRVTIEGRTYRFAEGYSAFADTLAADFPSQKDALHRYASMLRQISDIQFSSFANDDMWAMDENNPIQQVLSENAWNYLNREFSDPLLINVLSATSMKMELNRDTLPLFHFAHGNSGFIESSWRLRGDGNMIVESLLSDIRSNGGDVVCGAEVDELVENEGKIVSAHCTNGETYFADTFISDIHPSLTFDLVKQSSRIRKFQRSGMASIPGTFGMVTVSLVLRPQTLKYFNWNQYIYSSSDIWSFHQNPEKTKGIMISCRVPEDGNPYARQIDILTPMAWSECTKWSDTFIGHRGDDYKEMKAGKASECISLAQEFIPGLSQMIESYYVSTPLTYRDYTHTPFGSAYGMRKDCSNPLRSMLSPRTPISNLLLTGQNLMVHGVHGTTATSFFTCAQILGLDTIRQLLRLSR